MTGQEEYVGVPLSPVEIIVDIEDDILNVEGPAVIEDNIINVEGPADIEANRQADPENVVEQAHLNFDATSSEVGSDRISSMGIAESYRLDDFTDEEDEEDNYGDGQGSSSSSSNEDDSVGDLQQRVSSFKHFGSSEELLGSNIHYFKLDVFKKLFLYEYQVDFVPDVQDKEMRNVLLRQHEYAFGNCFLFDGKTLVMSKVIAEDLKTLWSSLPATFGVEEEKEEEEQVLQEKVKIKLKLTERLLPEDPKFAHTYTTIMEHAMKLIPGNEEFENSKYFFQQNQVVRFSENNEEDGASERVALSIDLWTGFSVSIRNHAQFGLLLCVKTGHKVVMNNRTVLDEILKMKDTSEISKGTNNYEKLVKEHFIGTRILSTHDQKMHKVLDVEFSLTPDSLFEDNEKDGKVQSYAEYYRNHFGIELANKQQPMLLVQQKKEDVVNGVTWNKFLIPSLCSPTGINDEVRASQGLMEELTSYNNAGSFAKQKTLDEFIEKLKTTPNIFLFFNSWDIEFEPVPVKFSLVLSM